jgi:imidazolonepropionase-like amidohydrolase
MNTHPVTVRTTALSAFLFAAIAVSPATAQGLVAVKGGRVQTKDAVIEDAVVLIDNGRIQKIGKQGEFEVPWEATTVDATGKLVLPTYVLAHSQGGVRMANERMENTGFVSIADALDPASPFYEDCLRSGVGTVHAIPGNMTLIGGAGIIVRPYGRTVPDMTVSTQTGLKLSLMPQGGGRLLQIRKLRRALDDAREYLRRPARSRRTRSGPRNTTRRRSRSSTSSRRRRAVGSTSRAPQKSPRRCACRKNSISCSWSARKSTAQSMR